MTTLSHIPPRETKSRSSTLSFSSERPPKIPPKLPPLSPHYYSKLLLLTQKKKLLHGIIPGSSDYLFGEGQLHYHLYYYYIYVHTYLYILVMLSLIIDYVI